MRVEQDREGREVCVRRGGVGDVVGVGEVEKGERED